ncbi:hypothetical protein GCK32_007883 [Trichostrongylus colubriformis]|uniref:Uncharacterized protein n=1 Tax=Trichostrongylus colubriformis TaxID=6319 RepID=A0AAN8EVL4_TRICO
MSTRERSLLWYLQDPLRWPAKLQPGSHYYFDMTRSRSSLRELASSRRRSSSSSRATSPASSSSNSRSRSSSRERSADKGTGEDYSSPLTHPPDIRIPKKHEFRSAREQLVDYGTLRPPGVNSGLFGEELRDELAAGDSAITNSLQKLPAQTPRRGKHRDHATQRTAGLTFSATLI